MDSRTWMGPLQKYGQINEERKTPHSPSVSEHLLVPYWQRTLLSLISLTWQQTLPSSSVQVFWAPQCCLFQPMIVVPPFALGFNKTLNWQWLTPRVALMSSEPSDMPLLTCRPFCKSIWPCIRACPLWGMFSFCHFCHLKAYQLKLAILCYMYYYLFPTLV